MVLNGLEPVRIGLVRLLLPVGNKGAVKSDKLGRNLACLIFLPRFWPRSFWNFLDFSRGNNRCG